MTVKKANMGSTKSINWLRAIGTKKWDEIEQPASLGESMSGLPTAQ